jgi:hypothetical protein
MGQPSKVLISTVSSQQKSISATLNSGINTLLSEGNSEIIACLQSGDYFDFKALSLVWEMFENNPKLMMVYGLVAEADSRGKIQKLFPVMPPSVGVKQFATGGNFIKLSGAFFRRDVFSDVGLFDEKLSIAYDFDFCLRVFKKLPRQRIGFINQVLAFSKQEKQKDVGTGAMVKTLETMASLFRANKFAPVNWLNHYFDQICNQYPFVVEKVSLVDLVKTFLTKAKPFCKLADFTKLVNAWQQDARLKLSKPGLYIDVHPDGWVSKKLLVKFRYGPNDPRILHLSCKGAWPNEGVLHLKITSDSGDSQKIRIGAMEEFMLHFEAPKAAEERYTFWVIETNQFFVPSQTMKKSKDDRKLSFMVEGVTISNKE